MSARKQKVTHNSLPSQESIATISHLLTKQFQQKARDTKYAPVKEVLALLGKGAILSAALLAPKASPLLASLVREPSEWDRWKQYNISYLQRTLRRLGEQKQIEIITKNGEAILCLTQHGQRKILKYAIDTLEVKKPKNWDQKWRLVLYDIPKEEKSLGDVIRQSLQAIGFYPMQESVYLYPYPCFEQIEFLREYYGLGDNVQYMLVDRIERDAPFKSYFGLS